MTAGLGGTETSVNRMVLSQQQDMRNVRYLGHIERQFIENTVENSGNNRKKAKNRDSESGNYLARINGFAV